jgi:hypothetical protein
MAQDNYTPHVGYGPVNFGMTSAEIIDLLGEPEEQTELVDAAPWPEDVLKYVEDRTIFTYRGKKKTYQEYTFYQGKLVSIALHNANEPLVFDGIDLFSDDRMAVVKHFADAERVFYVNNEDLWFAASGILISLPEYWGDDGDKVVTFRLASYEKLQHDFSDWEELSDPKDI